MAERRFWLKAKIAPPVVSTAVHRVVLFMLAKMNDHFASEAPEPITMSSKSWEQQLAIAEAAVLRAARLTKKVLSSVKEVSKADSSPVTIADFAAQALLISILHAAFPDDKFVGEEDSSVLRRDDGLRQKVYELFSAAQSLDEGPGAGAAKSSMVEMLDLIDMGGQGVGGPKGRFWVMDPVDGTATFLTGEQYAVSLALIEDGTDVLGAIVYPNVKLDGGRITESCVDMDGMGVMISAVKGQGACMEWFPSRDGPRGTKQPVPKLQPAINLTDLHIVDCEKNRPSHREVTKKITEKLGVPFPGTDVWSSHIRYAALILGGADFFIRIPSAPESNSCIWDHAGGQLFYREVGGKITDLDGKEVSFGAGRHLSANRGLVIAKKEIHAKVLEAAREVIGPTFVP